MNEIALLRQQLVTARRPALDADAIVAERACYARVRESLPAGLTLSSPPAE